MSIKTISIVMILFSNLLCACSTMPSANRVKTDDATYSYVLAGQGSPIVVLESGLGDGKESWEPVFSPLAGATQVFAYDRAGYGLSRSGNSSRDGATIIRELRSTLQALGLTPPYVLVGHSIGGTYMELYARTYPEDVAGVVFVDSRNADFTRQCQVANAGRCTPSALLSLLMPPGPRREVAGIDQTIDQVLNGGPFPDVPLAILTAGREFLASAEFYEVWLKTQKELAALSANSTHTVCKECGHYVHKNNPQMVIDAVKSIVEQARNRNVAGIATSPDSVKGRN